LISKFKSIQFANRGRTYHLSMCPPTPIQNPQ
jgi:hypothetical protein